MQKYTTAAGTITATVLTLLLISTLTLLPIAKAESTGPMVDETCEVWFASQIKLARDILKAVKDAGDTIDDALRNQADEAIKILTEIMIAIVAGEAYQPDKDKPCEVWLYENNNTLIGQFIMEEKAGN